MNLNFEISQYFVYKKVLKKAAATAALKECERLDMPFEKYLLIKNICNEVTALAALGEFFNLPYCEIDMLEVDRELLDKFSFSYLKKHKIVPVSIDSNGVLLLAVARPLDYVALSTLSIYHSGKVDFILVPPVQVDVFIDTVATVQSTTTALNDLQREKDKALVQQSKETIEEIIEREDDVINAPAVRLVDSIIKEAIPFRASDIHIEPFEKIVRVRYRIDGDLSDRAEFPIESYPAICARLKIMAGINIAERRIPQDGRINMTVNGSEFDFRVSTIPTIYGEKFVIRILDKNSFNFTRSELGFSESENAIIDKILMHPHGIVLLTGPTGCGKSTTLYSFLKELNSNTANITTVEDPVEYTMHGINQTQVNTKANMTFASALRSILRQDPDIIMIGEIRDEETAQIATRAAITGHLVFSTLHTNDAPGAVVRLEDMGVKPYLVADSVVGVISQRLVKKLCPACKKKAKANAREMAMLGVDKPISIYKPQGCQFCNQTGYKGRIAVHEIMYMTEKIRNAINKGATAEELREISRKNGMVTLWDACREYVLEGTTSLAELMTLYIE